LGGRFGRSFWEVVLGGRFGRPFWEAILGGRFGEAILGALFWEIVLGGHFGRCTARKAQKKLPVFWAQKKPGVFSKKLPTGSFFGVGSFLVGSFFARLAVWSHRLPSGGGRPR
jgi:hypothetical protein